MEQQELDLTKKRIINRYRELLRRGVSQQELDYKLAQFLGWQLREDHFPGLISMPSLETKSKESS